MKYSYNILDMFAEKWFKGLIRMEDIPEKKLSVKFKSQEIEEQIHGWELTLPQFKTVVFLPDTIGGINTLSLLPAKIHEVEEFSFNKDRYSRVKKINSFKIKPELKIQPEDILDDFMTIKHTSPEDFKSLWILALGSIIYRINWRISSNAGFGKDCVFKILSYLLEDVHIYDPKSPSKLMLKANNSSLVVSNEWMNNDKKTKLDFEELYKIMGDGSLYIENPNHSSKTYNTLERYDISCCSLGIVYNELKYYIETTSNKQFEFFDFIYDHATCVRYFPMLLNRGQVLSEQFEMSKSQMQKVYEDSEGYLINLIKSILWLIDNSEELLVNKQWAWRNDKVDGIKDSRTKKNFSNLIKACRLFSGNKEDFMRNVDKIWENYCRYLTTIDEGKKEMYE